MEDAILSFLGRGDTGGLPEIRELYNVSFSLFVLVCLHHFASMFVSLFQCACFTFVPLTLLLDRASCPLGYRPRSSGLYSAAVDVVGT